MNNLTVIEREGQRVLTTEQLAQVYETDVNNIKNNFNRNKDKFKENIHYYLLKGEDLKSFIKNLYVTTSDLQISSKTRSLYLWTERGASRHCKILDTDKAWQQFDVLETNYFKPKREDLPTGENLIALAVIEAKRLLEEKDRKIQELQPKADYFDDLVDRNLLTNFRDTAKELKVKEKVFIKYLIDNKYIYRDKKNQLRPYADKNKDLFEVKEYSSNNWSGVQTLITPKGRETFRLLIKDYLIKV